MSTVSATDRREAAKSEIRRPKSERNPKSEIRKGGVNHNVNVVSVGVFSGVWRSAGVIAWKSFSLGLLPVGSGWFGLPRFLE